MDVNYYRITGSKKIFKDILIFQIMNDIFATSFFWC